MDTGKAAHIGRNESGVSRAGRIGRFVRWAGASLLAGAFLIAVAPPARAQDAAGVEGDSTGADDAVDMGMNMLSRRGTDKYAAILRLDDDQKQASKTLFDGYIAGMRDMGKEMQSVMKGLEEKVQNGDYSAYQKEMGAKMKDFGARTEALQNGFFDDLKSLLREDQAAQWPRLERYRRREEMMQFGMVSGSGVDLVAIADRLKIDPAANPALAEQLDRYELDVDKPVSALQQATKDMQDKAYEGMADFDPSNPQAAMEKYQKMMEALVAPARQIRDINRKYQRLVEPVLPADQARKFDAEFNLRSFPRVYRKSYAVKALAAAEGFSDLTADQRTALTGIREGYERAAGPANEKWAAEIEKKEEASGGTVMQMMMDGMGAGDPNDPVSQARKARHELDDQTRERIAAVLTEDQKSRLPDKGSTTDNPWEDYQAVMQGEEGAPGQ